MKELTHFAGYTMTTMTVAELIEALRRFTPSTAVVKCWEGQWLPLLPKDLKLSPQGFIEIDCE